MDKIKLLMLSDSILSSTGFARVTREIIKKLCNCPEFDIYHLAWNYAGQVLKKTELEGGEELPITILSGGRQPYGADVLSEYFFKYRFDRLWVLLDSFMIFPFILNYSLAPAKSIMYFPSDGEYFPKDCEHVLRKFDIPVAMSKFGQIQVKELFNIDTKYIPHACDPHTYYPLTEEQKMQIKASLQIPIDAFVFGDVTRNQGRKMVGMEIMAFGEFMKRNPNANAYLFLWTDFVDVAANSDLMNLARRYNVAHRIIGQGMMKFFQGAPSMAINNIYNAMDVRISTTTGEGAGLVTFESISAEIPNIITNYTTSAEILKWPFPPIEKGHFQFAKQKELQFGEAGIGVPISSEIPGTWDVYRGFVNLNKFVDAMEILYNDEKLRKQMGKRGREIVLEEYTWDKIAKDWIKLFKE